MTAAIITRPYFGTFTIERTYGHTPARVYRAFEDAAAHYRWFVSAERWDIDNWTHDFRVGGHSHGRFRPEGFDGTFGNDTWHLEQVKGERIVDAYTMSLNDKPISHSLASIELYPDGEGGCRLVYTEQGAYYGGADDVKNRKVGCEDMFARMGEELRAHD